MSQLHIDAVWVHGDTIRVILLEEGNKTGGVSPAIPEKPLFSDGHGLPFPVDELPDGYAAEVAALKPVEEIEPVKVVIDLNVADLLLMRKKKQL
jgi:hypothetical protein